MSSSKGRMISADISNSDKFASLSPEAAVLLCLMIPHFNSHGKMNGGTGYIKDEVCPKVNYLNTNNIPILLQEISDNTNIKYFTFGGRYWIHAINFLSEHQKLNPKRLGADNLPSYSKDLRIENTFVDELDKIYDKHNI